MTDAQILAVSITVLAVLVGTLFNNSRLGDVKEVLRAETKADIAQLRLDMSTRFNSMETKIDTMLRLLADVDQRVTRLEARH